MPVLPVLLLLVIIGLLITITYNSFSLVNLCKNYKNNSENKSSFANSTIVTKDDINKMWAANGCTLPLTEEEINFLFNRRNNMRLFTNAFNQFKTRKCKPRAVLCPYKNPKITAEQMNELRMLWNKHPICKNKIFPECALQSEYAGLPYIDIRYLFVNEYMDEIC